MTNKPYFTFSRVRLLLFLHTRFGIVQWKNTIRSAFRWNYVSYIWELDFVLGSLQLIHQFVITSLLLLVGTHCCFLLILIWLRQEELQALEKQNVKFKQKREHSKNGSENIWCGVAICGPAGYSSSLHAPSFLFSYHCEKCLIWFHRIWRIYVHLICTILDAFVLEPFFFCYFSSPWEGARLQKLWLGEVLRGRKRVLLHSSRVSQVDELPMPRGPLQRGHAGTG